jgi:YTH domain-containing family protein
MRHIPSLNSLSAIAGQEGEEEDWEKDIRGVRDQEEVGVHKDRT